MAANAPREDAYTLADVTIVMPTYNEAEAIGTVLGDIDRVTGGAASVICVDGSSDATAEIARDHGARVIEQEPAGYGVALGTGLDAADTPIVVTSDCDDTYPMEMLPAFLGAINEGHDVVSGDRLSRGADAMPMFNRFGNHAFATIASVLMGHRVRDTTTGMRAYRRSVLRSIEWTENAGLSAELLIRPVMRGYRVTELQIQYDDRRGESTLDPLVDGASIARSIVEVAVKERIGAVGSVSPSAVES